MRAVVYDKYGPPSRMRVEEIPAPEPGAGEVRIAVRAAGLNPYDWHLYRADPWLARTFTGLFSPGLRVLGADVAGVVDAVGGGVKQFAVGDEVYGEIGFGAVGEFATAQATLLAAKPRSLNFEEAAAVPMGALTAYDGLRDAGVNPGDRVLVIGASGGVGHMAVQIARAMGAGRVVAVCSGRNAEWVETLGADRVIDYTRERVTDCGETFDLVYDAVCTTPLRRLRRVIEPRGVYAPAGAVGRGRLLGPYGPILRAKVTGTFVSQRVAAVEAKPSGATLARVAQWIDAGLVRPVVERVYAFDEYEEALARLETMHVSGKLVVRVP